jgi:predicted  nucleic acid-binding Zn-ribbon protein
MTARPAADHHTLGLLGDLEKRGLLDGDITPEAAQQLLKTPPTHALKPRSGDSFPDSPAANVPRLGGSSVQVASLQLPPAKRAGATNGGLPPALDGATCARVLESVLEESAMIPTSTNNYAKLARDHMQRSLLQLFEDTLRDKFSGSGPGDVSLRAGGASVMGYSSTSIGAISAAGAAARGLRATARTIPSQAPSLRPIDRTGNLSSLQRPRGVDALTDFIVPDGVRQQLSADIGKCLEHELQRLSTLLLTDVAKVTNQVKALGGRMTSAEEELMHAGIELDVSAGRLAAASARAEALEAELAEARAHCDSKDRQMDVLREQVQRRNASLDDTRVKFRKEVMRYKARIFELEMEVDNLTGRRGGPKRAQHIGNDAVPDAAFENPFELTAAVETAVAREKERHDDAVHKLTVQHAREKKALVIEHAARLAERDHEILALRAKVGPIGGGNKAAAHSAAAAKYLAPISGATGISKPSSAAPTPEPPELA